MDTADTQGNLTDEEGHAHVRVHVGHGSQHHEIELPDHEHNTHHHEHDHHHEEPMSPEDVVKSLLVLGQVALDAGDFGSAAEAYASALQLEQDETALYNLGSLYARGFGVRRDFVKAATLFHQAELKGNEQAGKLCAKCMFDYVHIFAAKAPADLYAAMVIFTAQVYPEAVDSKREVNNGLFAIASTLLNKREYSEAAKVFRAGAEYGDDGYAQYYLGLLYDAGAGLSKNDLAALYWLDRAVDSDAADVAREARDGMLDACRQDRSASEFRAAMETLSGWCEQGAPDVPVDHDKAAYWCELT